MATRKNKSMQSGCRVWPWLSEFGAVVLLFHASLARVHGYIAQPLIKATVSHLESHSAKGK